MNVDYSRHRNAIARAREKHIPTWDAREIDHALNSNGYPCPVGTWRAFLGRGVPTKHLVITLSRVFRCDLDDVLPDQWFRDLEDCRNPRCQDHG